MKGTDGDALFAVLCGCGHNIRMILRHLRAVLRQLIRLFTNLQKLFDAVIVPIGQDQTVK